MRGILFLVVAELVSLPLGAEPRDVFTFVQKNCSACHNATAKAGDLDLTALHSSDTFEKDRESWERVDEKLKLGQMPPAGVPHPQNEATRRSRTGWKTNLRVRIRW
ncbi:MAG TPA: c-type cytochrome domain-containing protein [Bryobacteraceae bacterium]|jgi:cytochrome c peroxidase